MLLEKPQISKGESLSKMIAIKCPILALGGKKYIEKWKMIYASSVKSNNSTCSWKRLIRIEKAACTYSCTCSQQWIAGLPLKPVVEVLGSTVQMHGSTQPHCPASLQPGSLPFSGACPLAACSKQGPSAIAACPSWAWAAALSLQGSAGPWAGAQTLWGHRQNPAGVILRCKCAVFSVT